MNWVIAGAVLVIIGFLLDREIYFYEAVHLGPRVQAWLYDRWSKQYDKGKQESQQRDNEMLAQPLLEALNATRVPEPFVLDFATGTGRLSYVLLNQAEFKGRIVALDLSQGMLEQAASKLASTAGLAAERLDPPLSASGAKVEFLRHQSLPLPFPDAAFDAVCALEVLELFTDMDEPLSELTRVLRPGGLLLTSRGTEESGRKAKVKSKAEFTSLLERSSLKNVQITKWWKLFDRVIAMKNGTLDPVSVHRLVDVLRCSSCNKTTWMRTSTVLRCQNCGKALPVTSEGIVLN